MGKYIFSRIIKSIISLFLVVSIIIVMIFTLIPRNKILEKDTGYQKITGDNRTVYTYLRYEDVGYVDFVRISDMCEDSDNYSACTVTGTAENKEAVALYENDGYTIEYLRSGSAIGYKDYNIFQLLYRFWSTLIKIDNPYAIEDVNNPDLERKYYIDKDFNGNFAVMCSGCEYKYQWYVNSTFPFVHTNAIKLDFGVSYPFKSGIATLDVINNGQGEQVKILQTFPTGIEQESAINQFTLKYKYELDHLDEKKYTDHYADAKYYMESPSMVSTSFIFGFVSLILSYILAIPAGISMSRNKDKFIDKLGVVFINLVIAMPSLALIFFIRQIAATVFNLPDKFPLLGFSSVKSFITPIIILTILGMPSLMTWTRRYMLDQSNSDYVKFARAKGLSQREIFSKHILKNAIIPIVQGIPSSVVWCISGALITESAFAIPGMGKMLPDSINFMNNRMVITLTFIFAALAIFAVLVGDLLITVVDPRIQLTAKKGGKK